MRWPRPARRRLPRRRSSASSDPALWTRGRRRAVPRVNVDPSEGGMYQNGSLAPSWSADFSRFGASFKPKYWSRPLYAEARWDNGPVDPISVPTNGESPWPRLAGLPLVVEACEFERLHAVLAFDFKRVTTHVRLIGAGTDGLGEDVSAFEEDGTTLHETRPALPLEGEWTLGTFCDHRATLEL